MQSSRVRFFVEDVHAWCVGAVRITTGAGLLFFIVGFAIGLVFGKRAAQWAGVPAFYAVSAVLAFSGVGSLARAYMEATDEAPPAGRAGRVLLFIILGLIWLAAGCGGFWVFTVCGVRGRPP